MVSGTGALACSGSDAGLDRWASSFRCRRRLGLSVSPNICPRVPIWLGQMGVELPVQAQIGTLGQIFGLTADVNTLEAARLTIMRVQSSEVAAQVLRCSSSSP